MRVIVFPHSDKVAVSPSSPVELQVNPTMSESGMAKIFGLVEKVGQYGPFEGAFCSRLARTADVVSVLALAFDIDFQSVKKLGQHANKDSTGKVVFLPGHENETVVEWQRDAMEALDEIWNYLGDDDCTIIVACHRPGVGGMVAAAQGIFDAEGVRRIVDDPALVTDGFRVFDFYVADDTRFITLVE